MNTETTIKPQPKLILPFLAWNFGWTWGFWLLDIILKNLWPDSPPTAYLALEAILNGIAMFGPMLASLIVLKKASRPFAPTSFQARKRPGSTC